MEDNLFINLLKPEYFIVTAIIVFVCIFSTWFLVALWTLNDAKKRFNNTYIAVFFGLFVLPLNLPGFIFYLVIRPELAEENVYYLHNEDHAERGINIPIARFEGENGFKLTINLDITKPVVTSEGDINVKVDMKESEKIKFIEKENVIRSDDRDSEVVSVKKDNVVTKAADKVKDLFGSAKTRVSGLVSGVRSYSAKLEEKEDHSNDEQPTQSEEVVNVEITAEPEVKVEESAEETSTESKKKNK